MPIKHAALKQLRKDRVRRQRNQAMRSQLRTLTKEFLTLVAQQKAKEAGTLLPLIAKRYDHAASRHVIHRNTAARSKARLMRRLNRVAK